MIEFNLSDNRLFIPAEMLMQAAIARTGMPVYAEEDVKAAIEEFKDCFNHTDGNDTLYPKWQIFEYLNKIVGLKLTK